MRQILKIIFLNTIAILLVSKIAPGLTYNQNIKTLVIAAFVFAIINSFIKPILKILLLPINIITLGLTGWFINVIVVYLTVLIVPGLEIIGFSFYFNNIHIVLSIFWSYIYISFLLNISTLLISWITK